MSVENRVRAYLELAVKDVEAAELLLAEEPRIISRCCLSLKSPVCAVSSNSKW